MLNSYFGYANFIQGGIHTMKKRFLSIALTLAMVSSMAVGCGSSKSDSADSKKEEGAKTEASADTESNQILFNGSSTLAPVITSMATTFFDTYGTWDAYDSSLPKEDIAIYVSAGGSGQGTKAVIDGTATFGMVARSVKDEEKEAIKDEKEYQVGIDALTIAVNPANPVNDVLDNLTTEQIVGLFSGEYATWKDLDSSLPDEEVVVITRDINGGAHEVFQKNIMGDTEVKADAIQASSMGELVQDIIDNQYAIGYASFGVANQNEGKVTPLKVNGVAATKENILDGSVSQKPQYGLLPAIAGTLYVSAIAVVLALIFGVACACFLDYYLPKKVASLFLAFIDLVAGIPSVIFGFIGLTVLVKAFATHLHMAAGQCILAAGIVLGIMLLPFVISTCHESLQTARKTYEFSAITLGFSREFTLLHFILPAIRPGIIAGAMMAFGRALGETMAVMMVIGNSPIYPKLLGRGQTLPALTALEMGSIEYGSLHLSVLYVANAVLLVILFIVLGISYLLKRRLATHEN